jgi:hypothetical protein
MSRIFLLKKLCKVWAAANLPEQTVKEEEYV